MVLNHGLLYWRRAMNKVYTQEQIEYVKSNAPNMTDLRLTEEFNKNFGKNVSFATMRKFRQRLGIVKKHGRPSGKVDI